MRSNLGTTFQLRSYFRNDTEKQVLFRNGIIVVPNQERIIHVVPKQERQFQDIFKKMPKTSFLRQERLTNQFPFRNDMDLLFLFRNDYNVVPNQDQIFVVVPKVGTTINYYFLIFFSKVVPIQERRMRRSRIRNDGVYFIFCQNVVPIQERRIRRS